MTAALQIHQLTKIFKTGFIPKKTIAVDGISLEVEKGEIFGLLGPNGAGKTTTLKCILGLVSPTAGSISVLGDPVGSRKAKMRIGFLAENPYVYDFLTGREYLIFSARLHGYDPETCRKKADEQLGFFHLQEASNRQLRKYSKGMLQRIGLAQALINDPDFLILDEPMSGLDPVGRKEVRDLLLSLKASGKTLLFSSHILSDAELICDRVAILISGKVKMLGTMQSLMKQIQSYEVTIQTNSDISFDGINHEIVARTVNQALIRVPTVKEIDALISLSRNHGFQIESIIPQRQTLEDLYLAEIGKKSPQ